MKEPRGKINYVNQEMVEIVKSMQEQWVTILGNEGADTLNGLIKEWDAKYTPRVEYKLIMFLRDNEVLTDNIKKIILKEKFGALRGHEQALGSLRASYSESPGGRDVIKGTLKVKCTNVDCDYEEKLRFVDEVTECPNCEWPLKYI